MVITKFTGRLSIVLERASAYLETAENTFARLQKSAADKLKELRQLSEPYLRKLRARSQGSFSVANDIFGQLRSQLSSASRRATAQLQTAQKAADGLAKASVDKAQILRRQSENVLRKLWAGCCVAVGTITQLGGQVSSISKQVPGTLLKARDAVIGLGTSIADKPRRMREIRLTRENELLNLLASSLEAMVVTDSDRRLIAANAKGLELFGISGSNMGNFTVNAFLANAELPDPDWNGSSFESREVRVNRCKIRRLDGGWRVAEYQFVADIVPRRHLYKFLNVAPYKITPPGFAKRDGSATSLRTAESPSNSVLNATLPAKEIPRHGVGPIL